MSEQLGGESKRYDDFPNIIRPRDQYVLGGLIVFLSIGIGLLVGNVLINHRGYGITALVLVESVFFIGIFWGLFEMTAALDNAGELDDE